MTKNVFAGRIGLFLVLGVALLLVFVGHVNATNVPADTTSNQIEMAADEKNADQTAESFEVAGNVEAYQVSSNVNTGTQQESNIWVLLVVIAISGIAVGEMLLDSQREKN